jgi:hypothetical protein
VLFILLPLLGLLAGAGAALISRTRPVLALVVAVVVPIILFYAFAIHRTGLEIVAHPGLWMLTGTWAVLVGVGWYVARYGFGRR